MIDINDNVVTTYNDSIIIVIALFTKSIEFK